MTNAGMAISQADRGTLDPVEVVSVISLVILPAHDPTAAQRLLGG